ncbi:MAG: hypothetical protein ACO2PN_15665 [Pyrobaculum sp.]
MMLIVPAGREGRITEDVHLPDADEICRNLQKTKNGRWVSIWLHQDIIHYLDMIARQRGVGRSTLIRDIVVTYIAKTVCRRHAGQ